MADQENKKKVKAKPGSWEDFSAHVIDDHPSLRFMTLGEHEQDHRIHEATLDHIHETSANA